MLLRVIYDVFLFVWHDYRDLSYYNILCLCLKLDTIYGILIVIMSYNRLTEKKMCDIIYKL